MKTIAIVPAAGIGDSLLMQIAARKLKDAGYEVTLLSRFMGELSPWFPNFKFAGRGEDLSSFDAIFLQHDNGPNSLRIKELQKPVYCLYGSHIVSKNGELRSGLDYVCDPRSTMAQNIHHATNALFGLDDPSLSNGITPLPHLVKNKHPKRIAIHPTSTSVTKNWPKESFLKLKVRLEAAGWEPIFIGSPSEAMEWGGPLFPTLSDLAGFLYESGLFIGNDSGPGHLASCLGVKTLTIGSSKEHLNFWRPGWGDNTIAHPPNFVSKYKILRTYWSKFISVNYVFNIISKLHTMRAGDFHYEKTTKSP